MTSSDFDRTTLSHFHDVLGRAVREHDSAAVVELYTENCTLLTPDGAVLRGREALADAFNEWVKAGFVEQHCEQVVDLRVNENIAVEHGISRGVFNTGDGPVIKRSNYVIVFVREASGTWLMDKDIWTSIPDTPSLATGIY